MKKILVLICLLLCPVIIVAQQTEPSLINYLQTPTVKGVPLVDKNVLDYIIQQNISKINTSNSTPVILQSGRGIKINYNTNGTVIISSDLPDDVVITNKVGSKTLVNTGIILQPGKFVTFTESENGGIIVNAIVPENIPDINAINDSINKITEENNKSNTALALATLDEINKLRARVNLPQIAQQDFLTSIKTKKDSLK